MNTTPKITTAELVKREATAPGYAGVQQARRLAQELQVRIVAANCYDREFFFYDGSSLKITADAMTTRKAGEAEFVGTVSEGGEEFALYRGVNL
jgi:hypothetical protein